MLMKAYHQTIWNEVAVDYFCMTLMVGEVFLLSMSFYMVKHFLGSSREFVGKSA